MPGIRKNPALGHVPSVASMISGPLHSGGTGMARDREELHPLDPVQFFPFVAYLRLANTPSSL